MNVRFLDINDYAQCVNLVMSQRYFIEKYWEKDYRYWVQPLTGCLHPEPYERFKGSFLNQDKKLFGFFDNGELISFQGLECYQKTDVGIFGYRVARKHLEINSSFIFTELHKFRLQWGESIGKRTFFGCRHPKITKNLYPWFEKEEYFLNYHYRTIATYDAYEIPTNHFHYEIMDFSPHAFPIIIEQWSLK